MGPALFLAGAIVTEIVATLSLKQSDGLSSAPWVAATALGYVASFVLLSQALRDLQVGVAYAIWSAAGTAVVAVAGAALFGEPLGALKIASLALIVAGVVGLNLAGAH
jgi:small multidrug resistance pump